MPHKDPEARRAWQRKYRAENREKVRERARNWYHRNEEHVREYAREYYHKEDEQGKSIGKGQYRKRGSKLLEHRRSLGIGIHGVDYSDSIGMKGRVPWLVYHDFWEQQDGKCAICGNPPKEGRNLVPDHKHGEKKIRGLLCTNCNHGIGKFFESPELLHKAIEYLEKNNGRE